MSAEPRGTYRVQLRPEFGFDDLAAQAGYLAALGVSHAYLSPVLQAAPGSTHGYDVVDHSRLNAELGGEEGFARLRASLGAAGLGAVADVVPNHVSVPTPVSLNRPLWSVLRDGPDSPYARWFDVDWAAQSGDILMPVLGKRVGECLADGEITLDTSGEEPLVRYFDQVYPVRRGTAELPLPALLERQYYRLAFWRVADEELNYRRFFDVDTLAGIRMEDPQVFRDTHELLARLVREGALDGLRIDHPDGMADPSGYLRHLAEATDGTWVVVEKILEGDEQLPDDWRCAGTTGYDAMLRVCGLFVDPEGEAPLTSLYTQLTGVTGDFTPVVEEAKRDVVERGLYAEVERLVELAANVCQGDIAIRDHTRRGLRESLVELLVAFPVYRAYVTPGEEAPPESVRVVEAATETARTRLPEERHATLELWRDMVLGRPVGDGRRERRRDEVVVRFQQTCGPVMAKGVEDTAFYRWFRLSGLNEVGGDPTHFGVSAAEFHRWSAASLERWPAAMTTLSTHDTKRSEDVRARLAVLSHVPRQWGEALTSLRALAAPFRPAVLDANTEYLAWQTIVGAWPIGADRLAAYLEKATREAKQHTTWTTPDPAYDDAVRDFAHAVLSSPEVVAAVEAFVGTVEPHVRACVLGQKLVQLTMPGVPDVYQGTELVDLSLVDPDNRRPVDYALRRELLERLDSGEAPAGLDMEKLLVVSRALRLRRDHPERFGPAATYAPVATASPNALAFARAGSVVVVVTTRPAVVAHEGWGTASVTLPDGAWTDVLGGPDGGPAYEGGEVPLAKLLSTLPVALLVAEDRT